MKRTKKAAIVAMGLAAMALAGASSASATTLEISGKTVNSEVTLTLSLAAGSSMLLEDTSGFSENTCKKAHMHTRTTVFTGTAVTGPHSELRYEECERTITVHKPGQTEIIWTSGTNGTVYSENAEWTSGSPFGHLNCKTTTTHTGTLTGVASGHATLHDNSQITCSGISMRLTATYTVTSPTGLGVSE